jgi:flavin reductase (DIM6/NTAB) family NADH-FMN oxidoreductase RutF
MVDLLGCNPSDFKNACSRFPTGVTITTVLGENGLPFGITVSSFTSVSLSPPIVLVCIDHRSAVLPHIAVGRHFGINVLAEHQQELSVKFSHDCSHRFAGVEWYAGRTGVPLFLGAPATFECRTIQLLAVGGSLHCSWTGFARQIQRLFSANLFESLLRKSPGFADARGHVFVRTNVV